MQSNYLIVSVAAIGVIAVLFWPRERPGHVRSRGGLIVLACLMMSALVFPMTRHEQIRAAETSATLQQQALDLDATSSELSRLSDELEASEARNAQLENELALLKETTSAERNQRAKEAAELEARLRGALEQFADIERRAGAETVTWREAALFEIGRAEIACESRERLSRLVPWLSLRLARSPGMSVLVEGHTDTAGSLEVNQKLSEQRARIVSEYLASAGIPPERITSKGMWWQRPSGQSELASDGVVKERNATPELRQRNRRVEVIQVENTESTR